MLTYAAGFSSAVIASLILYMSHALPDSYFMEFSAYSGVIRCEIYLIFKNPLQHTRIWLTNMFVMNNLKGTIYKD